jgi:hypothetical protein
MELNAKPNNNRDESYQVRFGGRCEIRQRPMIRIGEQHNGDLRLNNKMLY